MKKIKMLISISIILIVASSNVFAFNLPSLGKDKEETTSAVTLDDALKGQDVVIESYANGLKSNLDANVLILEACGNKDDAAKYKAAAEAIVVGNCDSDCLEKNIEITEESNKKSEELIDSAQTLDDEAKQKLADSLIPLAKSVLHYKDAAELSKKTLQDAKALIDSASLMDKMSVKNQLDPVLTVGPRAPEDFISVGKTLTKYVEFAKSRDVEIPKNATDALGEL